jgi:hypothetical protein
MQSGASGSVEESHCVFVSETRKIGQVKVPTQFYLMPVSKSKQRAHSGPFLGSNAKHAHRTSTSRDVARFSSDIRVHPPL